jgi:hypothetical protein
MRADKEARDEGSKLAQIAETQAGRNGRPTPWQDVRHQQASSPREGTTGVSGAVLAPADDTERARSPVISLNDF